MLVNFTNTISQLYIPSRYYSGRKQQLQYLLFNRVLLGGSASPGSTFRSLFNGSSSPLYVWCMLTSRFRSRVYSPIMFSLFEMNCFLDMTSFLRYLAVTQLSLFPYNLHYHLDVPRLWLRVLPLPQPSTDIMIELTTELLTVLKRLHFVPTAAWNC